LSERSGFGHESGDQVRLVLKQLFHLNALFLCAFSVRKPRDFFPQLRRDRGRRASRNFLRVAIEELQQNFEIIIHRKKVVKEKGGLE
jgi:hypothetical protein